MLLEKDIKSDTVNIVVHPFPSKPKSNFQSAKLYPYWSELISLLEDDGYNLIQVGVSGEIQMAKIFWVDFPLKAIEELLRRAHTWIAGDSFLPHLAHKVGRRGFAIFGPSDPNIFGYPENINIFKGNQYLVPKVWRGWSEIPPNPVAYFSAKRVYAIIKHQLPNILQGTSWVDKFSRA